MLDTSYSRPEGLYFWGYFLGLNALWFAIPVWLTWSSIREIARAMIALERVESTLRRRHERPRTLQNKFGRVMG